MKGIPNDKIDPNATAAMSPPDDAGEYYCKWCYRIEADHEEDEICDEPCGKGYEADFNNPVDPPERDPDSMPGGVDDY